MVSSTTIRYGPCITTHSCNIGDSIFRHIRPSLDPFTTWWRCSFEAWSEMQGGCWACLGCGWRWSWDSWGVSHLSDMVYASHNTPVIVGYHTQTCITLIGQVHPLMKVQFWNSIKNEDEPGWYLSISGLWFEVMLWHFAKSIPIRPASCMTKHSCNSGMTYNIQIGLLPLVCHDGKVRTQRINGNR